MREGGYRTVAARAKRIVILGGGFAGVYAVLHLERIFAREGGIEITLISDENFLLFTPLLSEVPSSQDISSLLSVPFSAR